MSAIRQLANPKTVDINVLVTPGVDYVNQNLLVGEVIDIVEEERADTIYVVTTPDKPYGAGDSPAEMYNAVDVVENLEDSEIDSNYTCSYYPWVKYYDALNSVYVYLPPTRDVVRNFAYTDNTKYPWFAAAGWNRGDLESYAVKPRRILKLGEQDTLYNGRLNFINNFANEGMKI
jgi:phage tail sheath protein FI